ncbi:hypothetical protein KAS31_01690 [Candidatus Parcubacteria bacterium]|nr:hypothetical protein [Candidatus Parcubacteria bacterium]
MNMKTNNKAIMVASIQEKEVGDTYNEMMDYTNRIMMVAEVTQEIERHTGTNSDVENDTVLSKTGHVNTSNRTLLCMKNTEFLFKRRALSVERHCEILLDSNSAFIIRGNGKKSKTKPKIKKEDVDKWIAKNRDMVPDEVLEMIMGSGTEAIPVI